MNVLLIAIPGLPHDTENRSRDSLQSATTRSKNVRAYCALTHANTCIHMLACAYRKSSHIPLQLFDVKPILRELAVVNRNVGLLRTSQTMQCSNYKKIKWCFPWKPGMIKKLDPIAVTGDASTAVITSNWVICKQENIPNGHSFLVLDEARYLVWVLCMWRFTKGFILVSLLSMYRSETVLLPHVQSETSYPAVTLTLPATTSTVMLSHNNEDVRGFLEFVSPDKA